MRNDTDRAGELCNLKQSFIDWLPSLRNRASSINLKGVFQPSGNYLKWNPLISNPAFFLPKKNIPQIHKYAPQQKNVAKTEHIKIIPISYRRLRNSPFFSPLSQPVFQKQSQIASQKDRRVDSEWFCIALGCVELDKGRVTSIGFSLKKYNFFFNLYCFYNLLHF